MKTAATSGYRLAVLALLAYVGWNLQAINQNERANLDEIRKTQASLNDMRNNGKGLPVFVTNDVRAHRNGGEKTMPVRVENPYLEVRVVNPFGVQISQPVSVKVVSMPDKPKDQK